jgi:ABC-type nitrate/sulfonate/bicarbonate transport system substrate-binding protein
MPMNETTLRVNVFPGGFNWPLYTGIDKGFFAGLGLSIEILGTPNSVTQMTELSQGRFEIAMTAVDNIVAYREGQGEAPIGPQPQFFAFMGSDSGFLSLVAGPHISSIADLAGKALSVDALTTGYAFVLYDVLRRSGLDMDAYSLRRVGGMVQRLNSLLAGNEAATLLSAPYNFVARSKGQVELVKAVDVIGPYQGNVAAARRDWARDHGDLVAGFIRGYRRSVGWLYQPANRTEAMEILLRNVPGMTPEIAQASYAELLAPVGGFSPQCEIDIKGLANVLALRSRYAEQKRLLSDPMVYCDLSYYQAAISRE